MPTYEYACTKCGESLEAVQSFSDAPLTKCPACKGKLRKVFSPVGVVFKGSGFYKTDSRSGKSTVSSNGTSESKSSETSDTTAANASTSTDAASSASSKSDSGSKSKPSKSATSSSGSGSDSSGGGSKVA